MANVELKATNVHVNPALIPLLKGVRRQTRLKSIMLGFIVGAFSAVGVYLVATLIF